MDHATNLVSLDAERERRHYLALAHASDAWQQIKASCALEGIATDDFNAEIAGRMIAGVMTLDQAYAAVRRRHGLAKEGR